MIREPAPAPPKGFRPHMPISVKLDAALRALGLEPREVDFDHDPPLQLRIWCPEKRDTIPPANDPNHIVPRARAGHKAKTAKTDVPAIAKTKRLARDQEVFRARLLAKDGGDEPPPPSKRKRQWPSRSFQQGKRPFPNQRKDTR